MTYRIGDQVRIYTPMNEAPELVGEWGIYIFLQTRQAIRIRYDGNILANRGDESAPDHTVIQAVGFPEDTRSIDWDTAKALIDHALQEGAKS